MRADRLISMLMLLQSRGKMTAAKIAEELEVSERTVYRDMDSLSISGIPVYADGGPGGGYTLMESYRSDLTGLNKSEQEALFLASIPGPLSELSISRELRSAVRKLSGNAGKRELFFLQRVHLDSSSWFQKSRPQPMLSPVQQAVWQDKKVEIGYVNKKGKSSARIICPYGIVAKAGSWYVVADTDRGFRVFRVSRILNMNALEETFDRDEEFLLEDFWNDWINRFEGSLKRYETTLSFSPEGREIAEEVAWPFLKGCFESDKEGRTGWSRAIVPFADIYEASGQILGFGSMIKVIEPAELKKYIVGQAKGIISLYEKGVQEK